MRQKSVVALGMIVALVMCGSGWATTLLQLDTEALTLRSDAIVTGRVALVPKTQKDGAHVYTNITILVDDYVKASAEVESNQYIQIRQIGGSYNGVTTVVPGMPKFTNGERVMLFLRRSSNQKYFGVVGLSQGKFQIRTDPNTGREYLIQHSGHATSVPIQHSSSRVGFNVDSLTKKTDTPKVKKNEKRDLEEFIREVKAYMNPDTPDKVLTRRQK